MITGALLKTFRGLTNLGQTFLVQAELLDAFTLEELCRLVQGNDGNRSLHTKLGILLRENGYGRLRGRTDVGRLVRYWIKMDQPQGDGPTSKS